MCTLKVDIVYTRFTGLSKPQVKANTHTHAHTRAHTYACVIIYQSIIPGTTTVPLQYPLGSQQRGLCPQCYHHIITKQWEVLFANVESGGVIYIYNIYKIYVEYTYRWKYLNVRRDITPPPPPPFRHAHTGDT